MPTCAVVTAKFANYVSRDSDSHGMPLRYAYPPYPVGWVSKEVLRGYVDGNDPVTGRPLMQEMVDALTQPLTDDEKNPKVIQRPKRPRLLKKDTAENYKRLFIENGWTQELVYYWFPQRGRILTHLYQLKLYTFWDALTKHRTDGALVRLITPLYPDEKLEDAEARLQGFTQQIVPILDEFIPK